MHAEPQDVQDRIKKGDKLWMMGFGTGMHSFIMARRHGMVTSCLQQQQCTTASKPLSLQTSAPNQLDHAWSYTDHDTPVVMGSFCSVVGYAYSKHGLRLPA